MKTLYLECGMGAAGDMLMSALLGLKDNPEDFIVRLNNIGIPNVKIEAENVTKCGIAGTHVRVFIDGAEEGHHHKHYHGHHHEHHHGCVHETGDDEARHEHHCHTGMDDIQSIINSLTVSDKVKTDALNVYGLIAEAESFAHGRPVTEIHFHEVGMMDAVADIVGVCMLIEELSPDRIIASRVNVGSGHIKCAHGILPVPAPATVYILRSVPTCGGEIDGELCTPTGAALLKYFADEFSDKYSLNVSKIGYGMGSRSFYDKDSNEILSCVRAMMGESGLRDEIIILSCNIDDMTGEQTGFALERILEGGALDAFTSPVYMKKNRPGVLLTVICTPEDNERMAALIFKYTTTIGIREMLAGRYVLSRCEEEAKTEYGNVRIKRSNGYGVTRVKAEYEDIRRLAIENDIAIGDVELKY